MKLRVTFDTEIEIVDERDAVIDMLETTFKELTLPFHIRAAVVDPKEEATAPMSSPLIQSVKQVAAQPDRLLCFTDGGCLGGGGAVGAWAYLIQPVNEPPVFASEAESSTTISRMELTALLRLLEAIEIGTPLKVFCDSEYVVKGCNQWSKNWVKNGWKTNAGGDVANQDLWEPLVQLFSIHDIQLVHVNGHSGNPGNDFVDKLCTEAMQEMVKGVPKAAKA